MIVCWENDLELRLTVKGEERAPGIRKPVEVLELKKIVEEKKPNLILNDRPPPSPLDEKEWSKEKFLCRLREKVGEETYNWVKELIELCQGRRIDRLCPT